MRAARWIAPYAVGCIFFVCNAFALNDLGRLAAQSKTAMICWSLPEPGFQIRDDRLGFVDLNSNRAVAREAWASWTRGIEKRHFVFLGTWNGGTGGIFRGAFNGTLPWTLTSSAYGSYSLRGVALNALQVRLSISHGRISLESQAALAGEEDSTVGSVPEPSSLYLLVTGFLGVFGIIRKQLI